LAARRPETAARHRTSAGGVFQPDDFQDVSALEAGFVVKDARGALESLDAFFWTAGLGRQERATSAGRNCTAMNEEGQHRKPWIAAFHC